MLLHRHHIRVFLQTLLALFTCASCVNDNIVDVEDTFLPGTTYYLALQFRFDQSTRSNSYEYGDHDEHAIGPSGNLILLFDNNDGFIDASPLMASNFEHEDTNGEYQDGKYEAKYSRILHYNPKEKGSAPAKALVVLNASDAVYYMLRRHKQGDKLENVLEEVWGTDIDDDPRHIGRNIVTERDGTKTVYFTMTNAVYCDEKKNDSGNRTGEIEIRNAVDINANFYPTMEEAKANPVSVPVERMVAKYTFQIDKNKKKADGSDDEADELPGDVFWPSKLPDIVLFNRFDDDDAPKYIAKKWRVKVIGWNINAHERKSYLFKKITKASGSDYFNGWKEWSDWNNPAICHSFWSEDPDYGNYNYPWQHREAIDETSMSYYDDIAEEKVLKNYSFSELGLGEFENKFFEEDKPFDVVYTTEHTYNNNKITDKDYDDRSELLAGTHLLVGAKLLVQDGGRDENKSQLEFEEVENMYRDRNGLYYRTEQECFVAMVHTFSQLLKSQSVMKFHLYDWDRGTKQKFADELVANTSGQYKMFFIEKDGQGKPKELDSYYLEQIMNMSDEEFHRKIGNLAPTTLKGGDGKCLPWIEGAIETERLLIQDDFGDPIHICFRDVDQYGALIAGQIFQWYPSPNQIKSLIYEWLGAIDHFQDGKMYYAKGIYHCEAASNDDKNLYGVVRNCWYNLTLTDIQSMGIPVDNPDQPIVPDRVENKDQINVKVQLLPYHKVETTTPELPQ